MRRPGDTTPAPRGGRAAARQRMYEKQSSAEPATKKTTVGRGTKKRQHARTEEVACDAEQGRHRHLPHG
jgi:hypothetical protein